MTAQVPEKLRYQDEEVSMCTTPLDDYFCMGGSKPNFEVPFTALWRGYVGTWEILNNRLYLIDLQAAFFGGSEASVSTIFPDTPQRVFAHWYSGTLRVPQGKLLKYVHGGFGSTYERDQLLEIERGLLVETRVISNV